MNPRHRDGQGNQKLAKNRKAKKWSLFFAMIAVPLVAYPLSLSDYLNESKVTASSDQFETVFSNNIDDVQIVPNAELVLVKQVVNDDGGDGVLGDFGLSTNAGALTFDTGTVAGSTTTYTSETIYVAPGTYSLTEKDVDGYTEGAWACTTGLVGNDDFAAGSVTLAFGEQTVCTIVNDDIAPILTLTKNVINDDGGNKLIADFDLLIDSAIVISGTPTTVASNSSISISEVLVAGYDEGVWNCTDSSGLTSGLPTAGVATSTSFVLEEGADVNCSITNNDVAPTLTLVKNVKNDNGGTLSVSDFDLMIDSSSVSSGVQTTVAANTGILISEVAENGYLSGTWSCVDANGLTTGLPTSGLASGEKILLSQGADVTCSIRNDDIAPTLILTKSVVNDDGGALTVGDFILELDGTSVDSGVTNVVSSNTTIKISEQLQNGYLPGTWSCVDKTGFTSGLPTAGLATGEAITLAPGAVVNCAIENNDIAPKLTLEKTVINDNGGSLLVSDFELLIDTTPVTSGLVNSVAANTAILISETAENGYADGAWSCVDANGFTAGLPTAGASSGESIELSPGADVTCSIVNDDIAPALTLTKVIVNDDGGVLTVSDFDLQLNSASVVSGVSNVVAANSTIEISEIPIDGYASGNWSCADSTGFTTGLPTAGSATGENLVLAPGSDVNCTIVNNDIAPMLTLVKAVVNDNGGSLTIADFDLLVGAASVVSGTSTTQIANQTIQISEVLQNGYTPGTWSCLDQNSLTTGLPVAGLATGADITLASGADVICSITNDDAAPTLTLVKNVVNDDGGSLAVGDFSLEIDGNPVTSGVATIVGANAAIEIKETLVDGYLEGTWSCSDASGFTTGLPTAGAAIGETITLAEGADVTCEITNNDVAPKLTLVKNVVNNNGGLLTVADFDLQIDGGSVVSGAANTMVANSAIEIKEILQDGYQEGTWACVDATGFTSGLPGAGLATGEDITLSEGADVTCSISNNDIAPTLTLTKTVINDNGGSLLVSDVELLVDTVPVTSGIASTVVANTVIQISETLVDGYKESSWSCIDATGFTSGLPVAGAATGTAVTLSPGAQVNCSISNDDVAPTLKLVKSVINDDGGDLTVADFVLNVDSNPVVSGVPVTVSANTAIEIKELSQNGYQEGSWSCVDATGFTSVLPTAGAAAGESISLSEGADVTCSIANNDIAPLLTLTKVVVNDNGGSLAVSDFDLSLDAAPVVSGVQNTVTANLPIDISETPVDGYQSGTWSCIDASGFTTGLPSTGAAIGTAITLEAGADVNCVITNDDVAPLLTLTKLVQNDDGGILNVADFDLQIDSLSVTSGASNSVAANAAIEIKELAVDGYQSGTWSCVDSNGLTANLPTTGNASGEILTLAEGSDVNCSITNDDIAPVLTLTKTVVNDNGGTLTAADFDLKLDTTVVSSGVPNTVFSNTPILVSESDLTAYAEGTWSCVDANSLTADLPAAGLATGVTISLASGADVTCSITNDDQGIDLSIVKAVDDATPNIGQVITFTLTVTNAGPDIATNVSVSDLVKPGFSYVAGSITGGSTADDLSPGSGTGLNWTLNTLGVGTPAVLTFQATVNAP